MSSTKTHPTIQEPFSTMQKLNAKDLDFSKLQLTTPTNDMAQSTAPTSYRRNPSSSMLNTGRKPGNHNGSQFSSFTASTQSRMKHSKSSFLIPRVQIQAIIRTKPDLYFDESLGSNYDEVLESGYEKVSNLKSERDTLKEEEEYLREQINILEREILPEKHQTNVLIDKIQAQKVLQSKFMSEIELNHAEIQRSREAIVNRREEIKRLLEAHLQKIGELESRGVAVRNETAANKGMHKERIMEYEEVIKANKEKSAQMQNEIKSLKQEYERVKAAQNEKVKKMENKSKMFLGILKH